MMANYSFRCLRCKTVEWEEYGISAEEARHVQCPDCGAGDYEITEFDATPAAMLQTLLLELKELNVRLERVMREEDVEVLDPPLPSRREPETIH